MKVEKDLEIYAPGCGERNIGIGLIGPGSDGGGAAAASGLEFSAEDLGAVPPAGFVAGGVACLGYSGERGGV